VTPPRVTLSGALKARSRRTSDALRVEVTRGAITESVHRVAACASDRHGNVLFAAGPIEAPVYLRSTAKPFIAAAAVRAGVVERFGFEPHEIALMAASHNGQPFHIAAVRSMLCKIGLSESALVCGAHPPYDSASAQALTYAGVAFTPIHNNCSGKHAGILALCTLLQADTATYCARDNPAQQEILSFCARACGRTVEELPVGIDGCGIPVFAVSLRGAALAFARFATLEGLDDRDAAALRSVREAMIAFPDYVAGTGEFDTAILRVAAGRIAAKSGAEGVHGLADLANGTGLSLKVLDGAARACPPAALSLVRRLDLLDAGALASLASFERAAVYNRAGVQVGTIQPSEGDD
jgi:L-asparaginase II